MNNMNQNNYVGSMAEWLERRACDQYSLGSKPTCAIFFCLLYDTIPCLVVLASSSKFQSYLY